MEQFELIAKRIWWGPPDKILNIKSSSFQIHPQTSGALQASASNGNKFPDQASISNDCNFENSIYEIDSKSNFGSGCLILQTLN